MGKIQTALLGSIEPASTRRSSSGATPTVSTSFSAQRPPPPCASYVAELEVSTLARFEASAKTDKVRRFKEFFDGAGSWSRVERIFAEVEVGAQGADTRFIATNLAGGKAKALYEDVYCRRGAAENHIKSWKTLSRRRPHLLHKSDGQPVPAVPACRRLLADVGPARRDAEALVLRSRPFDTLRLRLIKIAARVVEMKTQIRLHLPTSCPDQRSCASSSTAFRGS
ncbi:hypothetical protein CIT25_26875 [Mesorhizobium mediterraneum]|uniref:Transposase DDE domain-containing protein n=1 Tax=Mesorhizobium mediterraneum TaxID=43617 RepID=A0AB36R3X1_9HYPH|nr:hypothetical protein CIT25_26875 [Mesorhizobium mediterraneum]